MYYAKLRITKLSKNIDIVIDFGVYSRPSTAERRRKELADINPSYCFTLTLENYESRTETEDS